MVHLLTTQAEAPALPTGVPGIQRHAVKIPGTAKPVQVLRCDDDDGVLADLRIAGSDAQADVRKAASAMQREAQRRAASRAGVLAGLAKRKRVGGSSAAARNEASKRTPQQHVWSLRKKQLAPLHQAYVETLRGKQKFTGADFVQLLQQRASEPTDVAGIDRGLLRLPGVDRDIRLLVHRDPGGDLTDLRLLPSIEAEDHVLDEMAKFQRRRGGGRWGQQARRTGETTYTKHLRSQWVHLGVPLQPQFQAYERRMHSRHESRAEIIAFLRHLDALCDKHGGTVVNAEHGITRHVLPLEGSDKPTTLLRRATAGEAPTLRHVGPGPMDEAMTIKDMIGRIRRGKALAAKAAAGPSALPAPTEPVAAPAGARVPRRPRSSQLTSALEVMAANKAAGKRNLLEGADHVAGLDGPTLRSWFAHDGRLRRSLDALSEVPGFFEERDAFHQHLSALGHEDQAEQLPQPLSADLVAAVLQAQIDHPSATSTASLARLTRGNRRVLDRTIDARTGALTVSDHRLRHLPGYDTHWQAIRTALQTLGQVERASHLPRPPTPGERFMRALKEDLYPLAAAANAMRAEPGLSVREAAQRMSDSAELAERLELLVGPGGQVRGRAEIEAQLPHLQLQRHKHELSALLAQLQPAVPSGMRRVLVPGFAGYGAKLFIVNKTDDGAGVQSTTKKGLRAIYADSPELVMPPRSFRHDRAKQALRWLSTVLKTEFKATEVQCHFDAKRQDVWVSSNSDSMNRKIKVFLASGRLADTLAQSVDAGASREGRHQSKLARKLAEPEAGGAMAPVLKAMAEKRFRVPTEAVYQHGKAIDLHAERRIKDAFQEATGEALKLKSLAGTMRPCTVCAEDLGLPGSVRRGPAWLSRAGQAFYDANEIVERNIGQAIGTYATLTRAGKISVNYNTDSDSSGDDAAARAPRRADPQSSSSAPSTSSVVPGKRKQGGLRIQEPRARRARVEQPAAPATNPADTHPASAMTELSRHLDAWNWPASAPATTWRPASPQEPTSPADAPPTQGTVKRST
ncbi:hypothetical protein [Methylibium rhizosphaerae]|uniref:hypothetical protein n=1 Tax=Methylibium rhizosphaerae TaxID=2570323 RepID=UPI001125E064|nr:hypothetical protein [Methylibium rhizosphaerae]